MPVHIARSATAAPIQTAIVLNSRFCKNFARGMIGTARILAIATRYPRVVK